MSELNFLGKDDLWLWAKLLNGKLIFAEMTWGWNYFIFTLDFYVKCARSVLTPYLVNGVKNFSPYSLFACSVGNK